MPNRKTSEEREAYVKQYDLEAIISKIDGLAVQQTELRQLILDQSGTYPTRTELDLKLEKRDNRIDRAERSLTTYSKVVWLVVSALVPMILLAIWQLVVNSQRLQA